MKSHRFHYIDYTLPASFEWCCTVVVGWSVIIALLAVCVSLVVIQSPDGTYSSAVADMRSVLTTGDVK